MDAIKDAEDRSAQARMLTFRRKNLLCEASKHLDASIAVRSAKNRFPSNEDPIKAEFHRVKRQVYLRMMRSLDTSSAISWGIEQAKMAARQYNERQKAIWGGMQKRDWRSGCCGYCSEDVELEFYHLRNIEQLITHAGGSLGRPAGGRGAGWVSCRARRPKQIATAAHAEWRLFLCATAGT